MDRTSGNPTNARNDSSVMVTPEDIEDFALGEDYALNADFVRMVVEAADRGDSARVRELMAALHPADVADLMGFLSADDREQIIPNIAPEALAEILSELEDGIRDEVLRTIAPEALAKALEELDSDDAVDLIEDLGDVKRRQVLAAMGDVDRTAIETALAYEEETAGRLMQREVVDAPQFWTVGQTIEQVRSLGDDAPELFFEIYVVDPAHRPVGAVSVSMLLRATASMPLAEIMEPVTEIPVGMDQEEVAYIFDKYHLISAPVVDAAGRLVGQITVDDVVGVIQEETEEDILALAGVSDAGRDAGTVSILRSRLPWLILNLATESVAVSVIHAFEHQIAQLVTLAVLMPIVSSVGGSAGTQTLAVAVRSLASRELNASNAVRIVVREMGVGIINGAVLAIVMAIACYLFFQDPRLSLTIGLALVINMFVAACVGILVPLTLERMGRDPAVASAVLITFVTDLMGFLSFLSLATVILL